MTDEVKVISSNPPKEITTQGATPKDKTERKDVTIVGGSQANVGPVKIFDRNSPIEETPVHKIVHPDRKSFKDAIENDQ